MAHFACSAIPNIFSCRHPCIQSLWGLTWWCWVRYSNRLPSSLITISDCSEWEWIERKSEYVCNRSTSDHVVQSSHTVHVPSKCLTQYSGKVRQQVLKQAHRGTNTVFRYTKANNNEIDFLNLENKQNVWTSVDVEKRYQSTQGIQNCYTQCKSSMYTTHPTCKCKYITAHVCCMY